MMDGRLKAIEAYRDRHWDEILDDIRTLVEVESVGDPAAATPGAPFGPGPKAALDAALAIAEKRGFATDQLEGAIGWADLPGRTERQVAIIGHVDVVDAGPGWSFEPFALTRKDGFLLGRGVLDDKGPLMVALHGLRFWKDQGGQLPFSVRVLMGTDEERSMADVACYRRHHGDPDFLFTPDGQFPLCYGEAGICHGTLESGPIADGAILRLEGGVAANAVAGEAFAVVRGDLPRPQDGPITVVSQPDGAARVEAKGVSAHASLPQEGRSAIGLLVAFLLRNAALSASERDFLELLGRLHRESDGSGLGLACADGHFGPLTAVGSVIEGDGRRIRQVIDFRYPTATSADAIRKAMDAAAASCGATFTLDRNKDPFLMDPNSDEVRALLGAYAAVTGEEAAGVTSKGGTYARCFAAGVCFGPEKPWVPTPPWVGGLHGADEGVAEALLKEAFSIYALALGNLARVPALGGSPER